MSGPPSPQIGAGELVYITYCARQVVLGWSPSLEEAKATACDDLGLSERGYTSKDIAFLFHPNNDPSQPLIEVMASAWPKLRPLPHFQLIVRSYDDETNHSPISPSYAQGTHHRQPNSNSSQRQTQASVAHASLKTLKTQPSTLTNSGKSQKSRESELSTSASNTEASHASLRVDIESWRRNQVGHPYQASLAQHQSQIPLPQHVLPSPPMSDVQSHRGVSPQYDNSTPSSPLSRHSESMDVDVHVHFEDANTALHRSSTSHTNQDSENAGFLAQTGRRTTVHFLHHHPSTLAKNDILAPTPIRRSHSQELLNADYTNFKFEASQNKQSDTTAISPQISKSSSATPQHQAQKLSTKSQQQSQTSSTRSNSKGSHSSRANSSPYHAHPPAKQLPKPSSLRQSWDSDVSVPRIANVHSRPEPSYNASGQARQSVRPLTMQRSSSHSHLAVGPRASLPDIETMLSLQHFQSPSGAPSFALPSEPYTSRRASLPDSLQPAHWKEPQRPPLTTSETAPALRFSSTAQSSRRAPAPVVDVDMDDDDHSFGTEEAAVWKVRNKALETPKRTSREKTLRRLKSSPSGLADQYSRRGMVMVANDSLSFEDSNRLPATSTQLMSATKRGPTSWPNSPVKRNTSLFAQGSFPVGSNDRRSMTLFSIPPPSLPDFGSASINHKVEGHPPLPPPPPPAVPGAESDMSLATRGLMGSATPPFLLDKQRPDSPMPPPYRILPPAPQAISMAEESTRSKNPTIHPLSPPFEMNSGVYGSFDKFDNVTAQSYPQQRPRNRATQSAEDLFAFATGPTDSSMLNYPPLPKVRSQMNLGNSTKSRRSRTH